MSRNTAAGSLLTVVSICLLAPVSVSASVAASPSATGGVTRIFETHPFPTIRRKTSAFAINAELGRAWVEVTFDATTPEDPPEVVRVLVPGLSYEPASRRIVFRQNDNSVDCAHVEIRGRGLFKREKIVPTGQCRLTHSYVQVPVDNGFEIENVRRFEVHLTTTPAVPR